MIVLLAVLLAGAVALAIALPRSAGSSRRVAGSAPGQRDRGDVSVAVAHATRHAARHPSPPTTGCHVTYTPTTWPGQFEARVTISNTGATSINDWTLTFTFPGDQRISSGWNTTFTQTGARASAMPANYYNAAIPPGTSQALGFLGTWNSDGAAPRSFRVNGMACR